jgi:hypothetical protein
MGEATLREIRALLQEIVNDRPSILDGTVSCRFCVALVLSQNEERHIRWHLDRDLEAAMLCDGHTRGAE